MLQTERRSPAFLAPFVGKKLFSWPTNNASVVTSRRPHNVRIRPAMSTSMPEVPEVSLPEPAVPSEPMDPELGSATAVVTVETAESEMTWLDSINAMRIEIPEHHPLAALRASAEGPLAELSLPNRKQEPWRFTELRSLYRSRYVQAEPVPHSQFNLSRYAPEECAAALVFIDGAFCDELSKFDPAFLNDLSQAGGYVGSVHKYDGDMARLNDMWTQSEMGTSPRGGLFPTTGNSLAVDAAVVDIPSDFSVGRPIVLCFLSSGGADEMHASLGAPRLAFIARAGSKVSLLECYACLDSVRDFSLTLSGGAVAVEDNANVSHYILNECAADSHVVGNLHAVVQAGANYSLRPICIGGKVSRLSVGIDLEGRGAYALLHGSIMSDGYSVRDIHSRICHNARDGTSDQLQKNLATDRGRAVFSGQIFVTPEGDGTNSQQLCRSLLLSEGASVDAMPVLEIETDEVVCSHGATVSDLRDEELFYLRSRGMTHREAQSLLVLGFTLEIIGEDCPIPTLEAIVREEADVISEASRERDSSIAAEYASV